MVFVELADFIAYLLVKNRGWLSKKYLYETAFVYNMSHALKISRCKGSPESPGEGRGTRRFPTTGEKMMRVLILVIIILVLLSWAQPAW